MAYNQIGQVTQKLPDDRLSSFFVHMESTKATQKLIFDEFLITCLERGSKHAWYWFYDLNKESLV